MHHGIVEWKEHALSIHLFAGTKLTRVMGEGVTPQP